MRKIGTRPWRARVTQVAVGVGLALVVSGCVVPTSSGKVSGTPAAPGAAPAEPAGESGVATFGQRFTFPSGLAIDVAPPQEYTPSRTAAGADTGRTVLVTTTVTNGTDQPFEVNTFVLGPQAQHAGQPARAVVDIEKQIGLTAPVTVLPGRSFSYRTAFAVQPDKGELQLEYKEGFSGEPAIFTGGA
jgi:hypothetical protein